MPSTPASTRSPGFRYHARGSGLWCNATPSGVPVLIMSPGTRPQRAHNATIFSKSKIRSRQSECWRNSPLTFSHRTRPLGSGTSSAVRMYGPRGPKPGKFLPSMIMLGKNFPGFGPLGPYILTADEVPDPNGLVLWLKVNGELRQHSDCRDLIFDFEKMVALWARCGLVPGDMISTGTPEGVALHHKPDPRAWYLKPGDRVEAGVDGIGVLETVIV